MLYKQDKGLYLGGGAYPYTTSLSTPSPPPRNQQSKLRVNIFRSTVECDVGKR